MSKIWTHDEVSEAKEQEKHNTPIHYDKNYDPIKAEKRWRRFVFFDNLTDSIIISVVLVGFVFMLYKVADDLFRQHGMFFVVSLVVVIISVIVYNRKHPTA